MSNNPISQLPKRFFVAAAFILCMILGMELVLSVRQQSQTWDESIHILAGNQYWQHRDFGANPEHPPLVKLISTFPLLGMDLNETDIIDGFPKSVANYDEAIEFLYDNSVDPITILSRTRFICIIFPLLLSLLLFVCCFEMFGKEAALLGLILLVFEPNILAHGALVTTDLAATFFIFASVYTFYRYIKNPNWKRLLVCGLSVALAFASKHSCLILIPILILLASMDLVFCNHNKLTASTRSFKKRAIQFSAALSVIFIIAAIGLWFFYSFRFAARPDGFLLSPTVKTFAETMNNKFFAWAIAALYQMRLLPESFLWGLTDVFAGVGNGRPMFLLGQVYESGKWFFFPLVFLMKSTLPFLFLLAALPLAVRKIAARREFIFLTLPPFFYFAISMFSGLNLGVRHLLPIFPFLIVLAALSASHFARKSRFASAIVLVLILGHVVSSLWTYPNYLTYSNEIVGGSRKTYRAMTGSDVDWGQGLIQASSYLSEHGITDCWLVNCVPRVDPEKYKISCQQLPDGSAYRYDLPSSSPSPPPIISGTALISASNAAFGGWGLVELNPYRQFFSREPDDIIAGSILVFHGTFDVSLAAAASHSAKSRQLLKMNLLSEAMDEARVAAQLAPDSAEMLAGLCVAMVKSGTPGPDEVCQKAVNIAQRIYPEFQFINMPNVKAMAEIYPQKEH